MWKAKLLQQPIEVEVPNISLDSNSSEPSPIRGGSTQAQSAISEVDAGGFVEVPIQIYLDDELKCPYIKIICHPEEVEEKMIEVLRGYIDRVKASQEIPSDLEVVLDG